MKKFKNKTLKELKNKGVLTDKDLINDIEIDYEKVYDGLNDELKKESNKLNNTIQYLISSI